MDKPCSRPRFAPATLIAGRSRWPARHGHHCTGSGRCKRRLRLTGGIRLKAFEAAEISAGMGDDTSQGGYGDNIFNGGEATNVVILDGARCDYEVTRFDDGITQVTDLRQGSPNGSDLHAGIAALAFKNVSLDLA